MKRTNFTLQWMLIALMFVSGSVFAQRNLHQSATTPDGQPYLGPGQSKSAPIPGNSSPDSQLFSEDFSSGTFDNWTIMGLGASNWTISATNQAGGESPEAQLYYNPVFLGTSRLVSPVINTSGYTDLSLAFLHVLDLWSGGGGFWVAVETTSDGGATWNEAWELYWATTDDYYASEVIVISTPDVGSENFQFCFRYEDNSDLIDWWRIDNIALGEATDLDAGVNSISGIEPIYAVGNSMTASAVVQNFGSETATFNVELAVNDGSNDVFITSETVTDLAAGATAPVTFDSWTNMPEGAYTATVTTYLAGDGNPDNDSKSASFAVITGVTRNLVVVEDFTGTWCVFCPGAALGMEDLIANGYSIAPIGYHSGDTYENQPSLDRVAYYGVTGYPTAWFDGAIEHVGGNASSSIYETYVPYVEERMATLTAVDVQIENVSFSGTTFTADIVCEAVSAVASEELMLRVVLTESHIEEAWMIMYELNDVERLMFNGAAGTPVDLVNNTTVTVPVTFELDPAWVPEMCEVIAFVQDDNTMEIFNGKKTAVKELEDYPDAIVEVVDFNGVPVEGATVHFDGFTATTGADGIAVIEDQEPGVHFYSAEKESFLPSGQSVTVLQASDKELTVTIIEGVMLSSTDFDGEFPPAGWTFVGDFTDNWSQAASNQAGGSIPELRFNWNSNPVGIYEFVSPMVDFTGAEQIYFMFKHMVDDYAGMDYSLYVMASPDGVTWETFWSMEAPYDMPATSEVFELGDAFLEAGTAQVKFSYQGDPYQIESWFVDDVWLVEPVTATGISENRIETVSVFPNPAHDVVSIHAEKEITSVTIYNHTGQAVMEVQAGATATDINVSDLNAGLYLFRVETREGTRVESVIIR